MQENLSSSHSSQIINTLHAILKPFLLRRIKADVEADLPPKKEYVLYAPLSVRQREVYDHVLSGGLRAYLMGYGREPREETESPKPDIDAPRKLRYRKRKISYADGEDADDDDYFNRVAAGDIRPDPKVEAANIAEIAREYQHKAASECVWCETMFTDLTHFF
jgi:ATP-dependent DNA helicase